MTSRVGPKGQIVIPKALREAMGLAPGDEVTFAPVDDGVLVQPRRTLGSLRGSFAGSGLTEELERDHRAELSGDRLS